SARAIERTRQCPRRSWSRDFLGCRVLRAIGENAENRYIDSREFSDIGRGDRTSRRRIPRSVCGESALVQCAARRPEATSREPIEAAYAAPLGSNDVDPRTDLPDRW